MFTHTNRPARRTRRKYLATHGDTDPAEYGGGYLIRYSGDGCAPRIILETVEWDSDADNARGRLYMVHLPEDVASWCNWADAADIVRGYVKASEEPMTPADWAGMGRSADAVERAAAVAMVGEYYGWTNLDEYPFEVSRADIIRRWRPRKDIRRAV